MRFTQRVFTGIILSSALLAASKPKPITAEQKVQVRDLQIQAFQAGLNMKYAEISEWEQIGTLEATKPEGDLLKAVEIMRSAKIDIGKVPPVQSGPQFDAALNGLVPLLGSLTPAQKDAVQSLAKARQQEIKSLNDFVAVNASITKLFLDVRTTNNCPKCDTTPDLNWK